MANHRVTVSMIMLYRVSSAKRSKMTTLRWWTPPPLLHSRPVPSTRVESSLFLFEFMFHCLFWLGSSGEHNNHIIIISKLSYATYPPGLGLDPCLALSPLPLRFGD